MSNEDLNKRYNKAIAVKYSDDTNQPKSTISRGSGTFAEKLILEAIENNIPIYQNGELLNKLSSLDFLKEVPENLYNVAADVMEFVYQLDGNYADFKLKEARNA